MTAAVQYAAPSSGPHHSGLPSPDMTDGTSDMSLITVFVWKEK